MARVGSLPEGERKSLPESWRRNNRGAWKKTNASGYRFIATNFRRFFDKKPRFSYALSPKDISSTSSKITGIGHRRNGGSRAARLSTNRKRSRDRFSQAKFHTKAKKIIDPISTIFAMTSPSTMEYFHRARCRFALIRETLPESRFESRSIWFERERERKKVCNSWKNERRENEFFPSNWNNSVVGGVWRDLRRWMRVEIVERKLSRREKKENLYEESWREFEPDS